MGRDDSPQTELQHRYKNGDNDAFAELFRRLQENSRTWVMGMMGWNEDLTEDVFSETKIKLFAPATRQRYDPDRCWFFYARQALRNSAIDQHRKRAGRNQVALDFDSLPAAATDHELHLDLDEGLRLLPDDLRELLIQRFLHGKRQTVIASERNHSNTKVSQDLHRALAFLRDHLSRNGYGASR